MAEKKVGILRRYQKHFVLAVICLGVTLTSVGLLWRHQTRSSKTGEDLIGMMENRLLDLRYLMRGVRPASGKVGIVAIDEKSLQKFGRWPIARKYYGQIFANLKALGVEWVGLDVIFSEPERPLLEDVQAEVKALKGLEPGDWADGAREPLARIEAEMEAGSGDRTLAQAFREFEKVVLGYFYYESKFEADQLGDNKFRGLDLMLDSAVPGVLLPEGRDLKAYRDFSAHALVANTEYISKAGQHFAYFNNELSTDGIFRWLQLVRTMDGNLMPSLSLKMAGLMLDRYPVAQFDSQGIVAFDLVKTDDDQDLLHIPVDLKGDGRVMINHLGPGGTIPQFSLADIHDMTLTDAQKAALKGMSLIIGPTAIGISDLRPNPFDTGFMGVEHHAVVVDNIVTGQFMRRTEDATLFEIKLLVIIGLVFSPLVIYTRAAYSGLSAVLFLVGFFLFDKYVWFGRGEWVYIGLPFIQMTSLFMGVTLYKYVAEERERRKVKGAFGMYLAPEVVEQLLADPEAAKLGGQRKELTVFFSDVRSFTTISESLSPEKLCELMNDYFTPMADIIQKSRGVLDKYIGDAIMAFWGAPIAVENHAETGCRAAVEMLFALDKLRVDLPKKGFPAIDIGIGLNTANVSVGNMGSPQRTAYTVMGDGVNLGSRLEGLTKEYGIKIMISEFTRAQVKAKDLFIRDLDDIRVKGKMEPVKVFELMRPDLLKSEELMRNLIGEFERGREAYRVRNWEAAKRHFLTCLTIRPDDGPAETYLRRIVECEADPHMLDERGVYTFKHK